MRRDMKGGSASTRRKTRNSISWINTIIWITPSLWTIDLSSTHQIQISTAFCQPFTTVERNNLWTRPEIIARRLRIWPSMIFQRLWQLIKEKSYTSLFRGWILASKRASEERCQRCKTEQTLVPRDRPTTFCIRKLQSRIQRPCKRMRGRTMSSLI